MVFTSTAESSSSIIPPVQSTVSPGKTSPALTSATGGISGPTVVDREFLLPRLLLQQFLDRNQALRNDMVTCRVEKLKTMSEHTNSKKVATTHGRGISVLDVLCGVFLRDSTSTEIHHLNPRKALPLLPLRLVVCLGATGCEVEVPYCAMALCPNFQS
ncbi:hypothetical protein NC651_018165 [Populus alba x Populus x berolinensis]|nr:hypothetical protein NC651_018165 [Populus alba x Populus x berolinensis]